MFRVLTAVLSFVLLVMTCLTAYFAYKYARINAPDTIKVTTLTQELMGTGKIILAEQKVYSEYIKSKKIGFSSSKLLFRWLTTYQYMIDLQDPQISIEYNGCTVTLKCPPIRLNEPIVDISTYRPAGIVLAGGILIDETKVINEELPEFKSKSLVAGTELIKDTHIQKLCTNQLKLLVYKLASSMKLKVDNVEIQFAK